MEKVKVCLYWSYITVTSLIGIISAILLGFILYFHGSLVRYNEVSPQMQLGFYCSYGFFIVPLLLAIIGLYGACQKKMWALILFAVGMILASLFMFAIGVNVTTGESELAEAREKVLLNVGSLVHTSDSFQDSLKEAQTEYQCCGLEQGYVDWGYDIPELCLCTDQSTEPCVAAPNDSMLFEKRTNDQPIMIYKEALSAVLCIFILCQMNKREDQCGDLNPGGESEQQLQLGPLISPVHL
ncbi:tetraspanin-8 isoform X2 [Hippoglossus stenolepis]|uniref:tetraspanin-8 isoform X2 n=1 Tax=Hippoglossus stenolepis TaxID=195615 RepID=UPI00159C812C|nr:tetraspanin-8 isoform X2 [Hippoglossus stenolepis]